jgi:hypothetical protein
LQPLDSDGLRELARALLTEARRMNGAIELRFRKGRLLGFCVVPDPCSPPINEEGWIAMAFEGSREVRAVEVGITSTKEMGGKPFVAVLLRVSPGQGEGSGRRYTWKGWLDTPDKRERTLNALRALGWTGSGLRSLAAGRLDGMGSVVALAEFRIETNPNDGKSYSTPAFINPIPHLRLNNAVDVDALERAFGAAFESTHDADGVVEGDDDPYPSDGAAA